MSSRCGPDYKHVRNMPADKHSTSRDRSPHYSDKHRVSSCRRRSRSPHRRSYRSRSRSSRSRSSLRSRSRSSSHSSRRSRDDRYRSSRERTEMKTDSYKSSRHDEVWPPEISAVGSFPPPTQAPPDLPPNYIPPSYQEGLRQPQVPYARNPRGPNFSDGFMPNPTPPPPPAISFQYGPQPPPPPEYGGAPEGPSISPSIPPWGRIQDTTVPPPVVVQPSHPEETIPNLGVGGARKEAMEQELHHQKQMLIKQREDYINQKICLTHELRWIKDQKIELSKEKSIENERTLRENSRIKTDIKQKLKSIDGVIEMLTNLIGDGAPLPDVINETKHKERRLDKIKLEKDIKIEEGIGDCVKSSKERSVDRKENFTYYDPGLYWCQDCNIFPKSVSQYLDHLHSTEHKHNSKMKPKDYPWHEGMDLEEKSPVVNRDSPQKRMPIRGVQFLIPSTGYFCSLCKAWLGDSHCAHNHIKSGHHTGKYHEYIRKYPHWEMDWLTERTRSYEKCSEEKRQPPNVENTKATDPSSATLYQLLSMLAKTQGLPEPPVPPAVARSSSSSSEGDSPSKKSKKKKKKSKKQKHSNERDDPNTKMKWTSDRKGDYRDNKPGSIHLKKELGDRDEKYSSRRGRRKSVDSREGSVGGLKKRASYDEVYNDHDDAVKFDMRPCPSDKDAYQAMRYKFDLRSSPEREAAKRSRFSYLEHDDRHVRNYERGKLKTKSPSFW